MSSFIHQMVTSTSLLTLGLYHLISTTRNYLKSPQSFVSKPFHPLPTTRFPNLPLQLTLLFLLLSSLYHLISSFSPDPLVPSYQLSSLHSSAVSFLFLLLSLFYLLSLSSPLFSPLPSDLFFALSSLTFFISSSSSTSSLSIQSHCDSISSTISSLCSALCIFIAVFPRAFVLDAALAGAICLQGLWALQTGMSLYVDAFIPQGCHRLLDVVAGVDGSTKCELHESTLRAVALLDLAFVVHVGLVLLLFFLVFALVSKALGLSRRLGSYDPLPTAASAAVDTNHVQLKTITGTQA